MMIMGIDLGIRKIAYSLWENGILVGTEAFELPPSDRPVELLGIHDFIYEAAHHNKVDLVMIEEPIIGNNVKYSMQISQTYGATLAALGMLAAEAEQDISILGVNVKVWKRDAIGNGNANKDAIRDYLWKRDSAYAVLCGDDQDRFDAACIGWYGHIIHERASALMENVR